MLKGYKDGKKILMQLKYWNALWLSGFKSSVMGNENGGVSKH